MSKFLDMFRILQKHDFSAGQVYEFGRCAYGGGTAGCTRILDFLRGLDFTDKEIIGFGQWVYCQDIADDHDLTLAEILELTTSGFSTRVVPALAKKYKKSENADETIKAFFYLQILGVDGRLKDGSQILLSAAKHACSYELNDKQRAVVKSILSMALERAVKSFDECDVWAAKRLLGKI
ncbi:MAG: hypothetical protein AAB632_00770 [Patescibacteria group bacterium]